MYTWLFRRLPGPTPVRVLSAILLAVAAFLLLMEVVFPAVESLLPYTDVAVTGDAATGDGA